VVDLFGQGGPSAGVGGWEVEGGHDRFVHLLRPSPTFALFLFENPLVGHIHGYRVRGTRGVEKIKFIGHCVSINNPNFR